MTNDGTPKPTDDVTTLYDIIYKQGPPCDDLRWHTATNVSQVGCIAKCFHFGGIFGFGNGFLEMLVTGNHVLAKKSQDVNNSSSRKIVLNAVKRIHLSHPSLISKVQSCRSEWFFKKCHHLMGIMCLSSSKDGSWCQNKPDHLNQSHAKH